MRRWRRWWRRWRCAEQHLCTLYLGISSGWWRVFCCGGGGVPIVVLMVSYINYRNRLMFECIYMYVYMLCFVGMLYLWMAHNMQNSNVLRLRVKCFVVEKCNNWCVLKFLDIYYYTYILWTFEPSSISDDRLLWTNVCIPFHSKSNPVNVTLLWVAACSMVVYFFLWACCICWFLVLVYVQAGADAQVIDVLQAHTQNWTVKAAKPLCVSGTSLQQRNASHQTIVCIVGLLEEQSKLMYLVHPAHT